MQPEGPELEFGAVTALIDRLERAGHITERRPNPQGS